MFREAIESIASRCLSAAIISSSALLLAGCSGDKPTAESLLTEAQHAFDSRDYKEALALTDSLHAAFPGAATERRAAMHLHAMAMEQQTLLDMAQNDSLILALQQQGEALEHRIVINSDKTDHYFTAKDMDTRLDGSTPLQARLSADKNFYLISTIKGNGGHTSITVSAEGKSSSTSSVPCDGERNSRTDGVEKIHFIGTDADTIGRFIAENRGASIILSFNGAASSTVELPAKTVNAIADTYEYKALTTRMQLALLRKEKLEKQLTVARNQVARTTAD